MRRANEGRREQGNPVSAQLYRSIELADSYIPTWDRQLHVQLTTGVNDLPSHSSARGCAAAPQRATPTCARHWGGALVTTTSKRLAARATARQRQAKANEDQRH